MSLGSLFSYCGKCEHTPEGGHPHADSLNDHCEHSFSTVLPCICSMSKKQTFIVLSHSVFELNQFMLIRYIHFHWINTITCTTVLVDIRLFGGFAAVVNAVINFLNIGIAIHADTFIFIG